MDQDERAGVAGKDVAMLLARCAGGDHAAFRVLYENQSPRLYGLALRLLRQPGLAADAVHDAFMQVWTRAERFDPERGHAEAWLTSLLRYRAIDILNRRRRDTYGASAAEVASEAPDALDTLARQDEEQALARCMQTLDTAGRRAIQLAFLHGLTHAELAERLQLPLGTVKSRVRRSLIGLKRCLNG